MIHLLCRPTSHATDVAHCQCQNMLCLTCYNTCAGGSAGVFIWPLWCPCGCLTCCCPLKICDVICCTCKTPEARCDSLRYIGQRVLYSGVYDIQKAFPFPTEDEDNTTTEADTYKGHEGPWVGAYPNQFVSWLESLGDLMTSVTFLAPLCISLNTYCVAPNTTWQPASGVVGQKDSQMNDNDDFGGAWVYPSKFSALPTPPNAKDADGNPLSTNVAPGEAGSRVIFWAHGSAFAITQAKDFVWLFAQMLSEQTGQVVLLGEYGLTSSDVAPAQLNGWTKTYTKLVEVYGAENVIIAGDSAGGCLSLATLLNTSTSLPPPAGLALFSPWVDLRNSAVDTLSMKHCNPEDGALANYGTCDYLPVDGVTAVSYAYANSADREDKLISPSAATVEDLVPLGASTVGTDGEAYTMKCFLTWGTGEILQDQQEAMGAKLADAGIKVTTYAATDMPHDSAVVGACMIYNTGPGGDYSKFEPTKTWSLFFDWLQGIKGWEGAATPPNWLPAAPKPPAPPAPSKKGARRALSSPRPAANQRSLLPPKLRPNEGLSAPLIPVVPGTGYE
mmetsp:Transcript_69966/g.195703  ORF Transcript_69966/g.195703 Transcript_69966/m.195703 type:complete len:559 (+) Transcript_69966:556-2232(+)